VSWIRPSAASTAGVTDIVARDSRVSPTKSYRVIGPRRRNTVMIAACEAVKPIPRAVALRPPASHPTTFPD
jgi:hypothetical protein